MAPSADAVLHHAASHIGYHRKPGSRTMFGEWYGLPTGQWCAMYLSYVAEQAGAQAIIPKHAYTPAGAQWFRNAGRWHAGIAGVQRGDIVYFDFPGAPNRISHVAIVESVNSDGSVNTIEGNTSGTAGGNQRNGGLCARKRRKSYIVGYGRPAYGQAAGPAQPAPTVVDTNADGSLRLVIDGDRGRATIGRWQEVMGTPIDFVISSGYSSLIAADQRFLNSVVGAEHIRNLTGRDSLGVDGDEGPKTIKVRQFWLHNVLGAGHLTNLNGQGHLDADGIQGPKTVRAHQFALNNATRGSGRYPA